LSNAIKFTERGAIWVLAVVDAVEDLASNKINRTAMTPEEALAVIGNYSGSKYDPKVVAAAAYLKLFKEKNYKMES